MTFVVTGGCIDVKDRTCIEQCPVDCIYEGARMLYIHPDECIDCGACEPTCPQDAIYHEDSLPAAQDAFRRVADEFFAELGVSGGAGDIDLTDRDHPMVAATDRQAG
jgi:NAD-dependent dihydropyrimidine dehydrogenase PreA subunit